MKYYIMVVHPGTSNPLPIMDGREDHEDEIKLFDTREEAIDLMRDHILGKCIYNIEEWYYL